MSTSNIRTIVFEEIHIIIKELKDFNKRFPPEFYKIYSFNESFSKNKIYKIIRKMNKIRIYNIMITNDIKELSDYTIIDILEDYKDKEIIFTDNYGLDHKNFYNIFNNLDILYFNWYKNKFYYNDRKSGSHFTNIYEKLKLIYYLKYKNPFTSTPQISTPTLSILEKECSYFPT